MYSDVQNNFDGIKCTLNNNNNTTPFGDRDGGKHAVLFTFFIAENAFIRTKKTYGTNRRRKSFPESLVELIAKFSVSPLY